MRIKGDGMQRGGKGSLTDDESRWLSGKLFQIGNDWEAICKDLNVHGYDAPASVARGAIEKLARTEADINALRLYWGEYAKERLAALTGPMNILRGETPKFSAYRSALLMRLRGDVVTGKLVSNGPIQSPQIEPSVKRYMEMLPDSSFILEINHSVKQARRQAALSFNHSDMPEFARHDATTRYNLLTDRYSTSLLSAGFSLDSHRKSGLVFRKKTSDDKWDFLFIDDSKSDVEFGALTTKIALTRIRTAVLPNALSLTVAASFSPDDIIPGFSAARGFASDSYPEFCLAADTNSFLARLLYLRVDALLTKYDS